MPELDAAQLLLGLGVGLAAGAMAGTLAGLAGIGGGLIYVPLFYAFMPLPHESAMAAAVFASMVGVAMTGFFSSRSHWRLNHIDGSAIKRLLPGLMLGATLGLWSTVHLPHTAVLLALALINGWIAFDYGRSYREHPLTPIALTYASGPIGMVAGLLGIGGGTMTVPLLRRVISLRMAVGTAAICGFVMAITALLLNLLLESAWQPLLGGRLSYLVGLWGGVLLVLPVTTRWAARLHTLIDEPTMRLLLKLLFATIATLLLIDALFSN